MNKELKLKWHSIYGQILFDRKLMAAWRKVEENGGAGGIDGETIESFKKNEEEKIADRFFDNIPHKKLMKMLTKYIADGTVLDMIWAWLKAGYMEEGKYYPTESGTPQGGQQAIWLHPGAIHPAYFEESQGKTGTHNSEGKRKRSGILYP
ncbi:MAG: hypothetical protein ACOY4I_13870 [Bacillota bacterium]